MASLRFQFVACLLVFFALHASRHGLVASQYYQDYEWTLIPDGQGGFTTEYYYRATVGATRRRVIELRPQVVYLYYNCHYMTNICSNARKFLGSPRGQRMHRSGLDLGGVPIFGYDLNTGKNSNFRNHNRRQQSCPGTWKNNHPCPEFDQKTVWRNDGPWDFTELEPNTNRNELKHRRDSQGNIIERSRLIYTCDEFPPATWVEGGSGLDKNTPSETRCAGFRCEKNTKAEQNWQAESHTKLRLILTGLAEKRKRRDFPFYDEDQSVILFKFIFDQGQADGKAAAVLAFDDENLAVRLDGASISQAKRDMDTNSTHMADAPSPLPDWQSGVLYKKLLALVESGQGIRVAVHANDSDTEAAMPVMHVPGINMNMNIMADTRPAPRWLSGHEGGAATQGYAMADKMKRKPSKDLEGDETWRRASSSTSQPGPESSGPVTPLLNKASETDIEKARSIVKQAIAESAKRNKARFENPMRNRYRLKPGTIVGQTAVERRRGLQAARADEGAQDMPPPLLEITDEIAQAAALVAEADASAAVAAGTWNSTYSRVTKRQAPTGTYWMQNIARKGIVPWGDDSTYAVFRNVRDYGATGNGVTDDTAAIKRAMNDGKRCGEKCNGSTTKNAIVYFPPGTYLISTTIPLPFGTQVIGDANNRPLLLAAPGFVGLGVLSTNEYTGGGRGPDGLDQQYYVNTANFYRQIRNIVIDVRGTAPDKNIACLHYQIAQATSLQNVELIAGPTQTGMFAENGSGGQISDVTFTGGAFGIWGGIQQFTAQRLRFSGCTVGVHVIWDWGWVWKSITMTNVGTGFKLVPEGSSGNIGSAMFLDSSFTNVGTVVQITPPSSTPATGTTGLVLENVALSGVSKAAVADTSGAVLLAGGTSRIEHWALGPVYEGSVDARSFSAGGKVGNYRRSLTLTNDNGAYYERPKPQYESASVGDFVHMRDFGATGDGTTDDTAAFQQALYASQGKILFVDAGSYVLTSTVTVPTGSRIVGETWSQLVAAGPYFQDAKNPKVLLRVGLPGQIGDVEMQDLIITTRGPTAGAILIEWNIKATAPGSAALWDCHVRIGGATGTELTPDECPALTSGVNQGCNAASLMMHITPSASGYFENMWLWVADHDIDDPDLVDANNTMIQNSVYAARGLLVESTHATWLYGTSSEHAVYYQYNFHKARNIFAGMIQTESPYFQPTPPPPAPFTDAVGVLPGDPDYTCSPGDEFSGCDQSWAVMIRQSENIAIAGAGLYSWFSTYTQECIGSQLCQKALVLLDDNSASVRIQHLVTIGAKYMAVMNGQGIPAVDNLNVDSHPFWSQVSVLDVSSNGAQFNDLVWIDPAIWDMEQPEFTCSDPCHVKIPPWTRAMSTVNYPLLTVSDGTWTSTITKAPLTISEWMFEEVTLTQAPGNKNKRAQGFSDFWPIPATTSRWPAVVYTGPNGSPTTIAPTVAFPTPPSAIDAAAAPPPTGSWPSRAIRPRYGSTYTPVVEECAFYDDKCLTNPLYYGDSSDGGDDFDEDWADASITCPAAETTSTRTTSAATKTSIKPTVAPSPSPSPRVVDDPRQNAVDCYDGGQRATHQQLDNAIADFCDDVAVYASWNDDQLMTEDISLGRTIYQASTGAFISRVMVDIDFTIRKGCTWDISRADCERYLKVPVDSCNCAGVDAKQGGIVENNCVVWRIDPNKI